MPRANEMTPPLPPHLGFAGYSGSGKTTLLRELIRHFTAKGIRIAVIKHAHHDFDTDIPGKDSYELRKSGAHEVIVSSARRRVHINELAGDDREPSAAELLQMCDHARADLIFVEGFKAAALAKIELHRPALGKPLLATNDENIIAVASDAEITLPAGVSVLNINKPTEIAEFIAARFLSHVGTSS